MAKQSTPAMLRFVHCRKSNASCERSQLVNFCSSSRDRGPATPSTPTLSVTLLSVTSQPIASRCSSNHLQTNKRPLIKNILIFDVKLFCQRTVRHAVLRQNPSNTGTCRVLFVTPSSPSRHDQWVSACD